MSVQGDLPENCDASLDMSEDLASDAGSDYNPDREKDGSKKGRYQVITEQKRKRLINYIESKRVSVAKAAKRIGIKYSTAKTIYATYLKEGRTTTKLNKTAKETIPKRKTSSHEETCSSKSRKALVKQKSKPSDANSDKPSSVNDHADMKSLVCRIRVLNPRTDYVEDISNKRVKTEETTKNDLLELRMPTSLEQGTNEAEESMQTQPPLDPIARNPLLERQILLSQLNYLLESNRPINHFQSPVLNPFVINTYGTAPVSPARITHQNLLNNMALQLSKAREQQQTAATMIFLNRIRK